MIDRLLHATVTALLFLLALVAGYAVVHAGNVQIGFGFAVWMVGAIVGFVYMVRVGLGRVS